MAKRRHRRQGRSSDFPPRKDGLPIAINSQQWPERVLRVASWKEAEDYSGGTVPDLHGIPFWAGAPVRKYGEVPRLSRRPDREAREAANSLSCWRAE